MPFLLAEILNFQGSTHHIGVGSFIIEKRKLRHTLAGHRAAISIRVYRNIPFVDYTRL